MNKLLKAAFIIFILIMSACPGRYTKISVPDPAAVNKIKCTAVLPLVNFSNSLDASPVLGDLLNQYMSGRVLFRTVPRPEVEKWASIVKLDLSKLPEQAKLCDLGKRLSVDGIFAGSVTEYGYVKDKSGLSNPRIGFTLTLHDIKACKPVWSATVSRSSSGVISDSLSKTSMSAVDETMNKLSGLIGERILDFEYRCGPRGLEEDTRCARNDTGGIDFDKCPEAIPFLRVGREKVSLEGEDIIFSERIEFVPGKAMILPQSQPLLESLVKFLNRNNIRRIRIESYLPVDTSISQAMPQIDRAGAVRKFLLKNGVSKTQIDVVNFTINPELAKGKEISNLRFVVLD
jgi:hypothetical protein